MAIGDKTPPGSESLPDHLRLRLGDQPVEADINLEPGVSSPLHSLPRSPVVSLESPTNGGGFAPYAKISVPPDLMSFTIFLLKNPATGSWRKEPVPVVVPDDLKSFPKNSVRLVNLSNVPVAFEIMREKVVTVAPQGRAVVPIPAEEQGVLFYGATLDGKGGPVRIVNTALPYTTDDRINLVTYRADTPGSPQTVKHTVSFERPPAPCP